MAIVEVPRSSPSVLLELALNRSARGDCDDPDTTAASLATVVAAAPSVSIEPGRYVYAERLLLFYVQMMPAQAKVRSVRSGNAGNLVICFDLLDWT